MTIIVDTTPIVCVSDVRDSRRPQIRAFLANELGPLILPAPVSAEIDYFLYSRFGPRVAAGFLEDLADGVFQVECLSDSDYADIVILNRRYADLHLGLADLSIVALARRFNTRRILTFDARHFRAVEPLQGGSFTLLPDDA